VSLKFCPDCRHSERREPQYARCYHPSVRRPDGTYPFTSVCRISDCGRDARYFEARTDSGAESDRHRLQRLKGPLRLALIWVKTFVVALFRRNT
jgi:hypothetical protein